MSIGGSKSKGGGSQSSVQEQRDFGSEIWKTQSPYLADLYRGGASTLGNAAGSAFGKQAALLQYAAGGDLGDAGNTLAQSNKYLQSFMNPTVDPAVNAYATNLGQQFNEQFLPGLRGDAALAGGLGGSRQQIGAALGAQRAMQTLGDFTAQSYAGQQERKLAATQQLAANAAGYMDLSGARTASADFARSMPWYNIAQYQGLLGSPVQIDKGGYSKGTSSGSNKTSSGGFNFGFGSG